MKKSIILLVCSALYIFNVVAMQTNLITDKTLFKAIKKREYDEIKRLSNDKDLLNSRNHNSETALYKAIRQHDLRAVEILVNAGAELYIINDSGETPMDVAERETPIIYQYFENIEEGKRIGAILVIVGAVGFASLIYKITKCFWKR
jgi:ankyrin repeat protein